MRTTQRARAPRTGRVGGPLVAWVGLLALALALWAIWLARRDVSADAALPSAIDGRPQPADERLREVSPVPAPLAGERSSEARRVEVPATTPATPPAPDPVGHIVWGYVLDDQGQPLDPPGFVRFVDELGRDQGAPADAEGAYSMSGLSAGRWYVSASQLDRQRQQAVLDLGAEAPRHRLDFLLARGPSLKIKLLTPDGQDFWNAEHGLAQGLWMMQLIPIATLEPPIGRFEEVRGGVNNTFGVGSWRFNGQPGVQMPEPYWGLLRLNATPPLHVSLVLYHDVLETQRVEPGQDEVTFVLDPQTISAHLGGVELTLVDGATGAPLSGARVMLWGKGQSGPSQATDAAGHARFDGQSPGLYDLYVQAQGKAELRREVDIPRGRVRDLGTIALPEPTPIRGLVVDAAGNGVQVEIRLSALPAAGELPDFGNRHFASNADGSFEIPAPGPGVWLLQVKDRQDGRRQGNAAELMAENLVVDTRTGPVEDLHVHLERVVQVVARWTGADCDGLRLRCFDERGLLRQTSGFYSAAPVRIALIPGTWRLVVSDRSGATRAERTFTLGKEPLVLELGPGQ